MKYDKELMVSSDCIAEEATILLALATQHDGIYNKIESATKKFFPLLGEEATYYNLEDVHWDITMKIIMNKIIYLAVVVRNLNSHLTKNNQLIKLLDKNEKSKKKLIDFCSKIIHSTEINLNDQEFIVEIEGTEEVFKYNIYEFCTNIVWSCPYRSGQCKLASKI